MCRAPGIDLDLSENRLPKPKAGLKSFYTMVCVISMDIQDSQELQGFWQRRCKAFFFGFRTGEAGIPCLSK